MWARWLDPRRLPSSATPSPVVSTFAVASMQALAQQAAVTNAEMGKKLSMKIMTLNNSRQKINDCLGNPIEIGIAVTWRMPAAFAASPQQFLSRKQDT